METSLLLALCSFAIGMLIVFIIVWLKTDKEETTKPKIEKSNKPSLDILKQNDNSLKQLLNSFKKEDNKLLIPIGFKDNNQIKTIDLNQTPNLLVIGTTGGGKSLLLNEIIASIAMNYTKDEIKIITIDTSLVELSCFNGIPHYIKETLSIPQSINDELLQLQQNLSKNTTPTIVIIDDFYDVCTYDKRNLNIVIDLLENARKSNVFIVLATDTPTKELLKAQEKIQGSFYLTLSPGEEEEFDLELQSEDKIYLTKIGNLIYEENNNKDKIVVPELLDEEIKQITNWYKNI